MDFQDIQFRQFLHGHSGDIRSVAISDDDKFIATISRDLTCKYWRLNDNNEFFNYLTFKCAEKYALTITYCPSYCSLNNREACVLIGGLDKIVSVRSVITGHELLKLGGHGDAVTCILIIGSQILTSSWDATIKHWHNNGVLINTYKSHTAAVWCLTLLNKYIFNESGRSAARMDVSTPSTVQTRSCAFLSGSADCSIVLWDNFAPKLVFNGHKGPIRDIISLNNGLNFISCSNDYSIKYWSINSPIYLNSINAHDNFIYSLCFLGYAAPPASPRGPTRDIPPDIPAASPQPPTIGAEAGGITSGEAVFATAGEENVIKIWAGFKLINEIIVPSVTNWCIKSFSTGGFVLGSAHASAMIFNNGACVKNSADFEDYKLLISAHTNKSHNLKNINFEKLEAVAEGIKKPGAADGEVKMMRSGEQVLIYEWAAAEWRLLGNALREVENDEIKTSKIYYKGAEYDYLIDVDVEGGKKLKLPYNIGEDPAAAADRFIAANNLPPMYFDQIIDFLKINIPSAAAYQPPNQPPNPPKNSVKKFPLLKPILFSKTNVSGLFNRLNSSKLLNDGDSIILQQFVEYSCADDIPEISIDSLPIDSLNFLFHAGTSILTPLLDMIKQLVLFDKFFNLFFVKFNNFYKLDFINFIKKFTEDGNENVVQMLSLKIFCNSFKHKNLYPLFIECFDDFITLITSLHLWIGPKTQISVASLIFNYTVIFHVLKFQQFDKIVQFIQSLIWVLDAMLESLSEESLIRILSSIGNILYLPGLNSQHLKDTVKNLQDSIQKITNSDKVDSLKSELMKKLQELS